MNVAEISRELNMPAHVVRKILRDALNKIRLNLIARRCYNSEDYIDE